MMGWYVVNTHVHQESRAAAQLRRQNFDAWVPTYMRRRRHARREDVVSAPLFPGYLFVHIEPELQAWSMINSTLGVKRLVCNGDRPAPLPAGFVDDLKITLQSGAFVLPEAQFGPGDEVRITEGPFGEFSGTILRLGPQERVSLMLNILGRDTEVVVPKRLLSRAS